MVEQETTTPVEEIIPLHCYRHPDRETMLRCNRCDRPICPECAIRTPTGYRCKECIRGQQKIFDTAKPQDVILAGILAVVLSMIGSYIASLLGFWTIFVAPAAGMITAEAIRWVARRRRSKLLFRVATGGAVVGALPIIISNLLFLNIYGLIWPGIYAFLIASTVYTRLSGIQLNR
jgi:hypothetical protein